MAKVGRYNMLLTIMEPYFTLINAVFVFVFVFVFVVVSVSESRAQASGCGLLRTQVMLRLRGRATQPNGGASSELSEGRAVAEKAARRCLPAWLPYICSLSWEEVPGCHIVSPGSSTW